MGLGLHGGGVGAAKFFVKQGAKVLVTDLKRKEQLKESIDKLKGLNIEYVLGRHRKEDFESADLIIKNPDVPNDSPYLKTARKNNIPIETDISLFFKFSQAFIIGITGTKGKSTVATLVYHFLKTKYPKTYLAGNIGVSVLEILSKAKKGNKIVLELSSFELENLKKSPCLALITNIFPDHLNRYKNMVDYIKAKKIIFKYQKKNDILILNYDNSIVRKFKNLAKSKIYYFSAKIKPNNPAAFLKKKKIFFSNQKKPIIGLKDFHIYGNHNVSNILAAVSVAKLLKISSKNIKFVLKSFKGVANRQEFVREVKGVRYFNDTTATIPQSSIEAIKTMKQRFPDSRLILIAGGQDKNLDYKELIQEINRKVDILILLPGTASEKIKRDLDKKNKKIFFADSMKSAVKKTKNLTKKGDIVLFSPAAASFNLFKNEFDRGNHFIKEIMLLK